MKLCWLCSTNDKQVVLETPTLIQLVMTKWAVWWKWNSETSHSSSFIWAEPQTSFFLVCCTAVNTTTGLVSLHIIRRWVYLIVPTDEMLVDVVFCYFFHNQRTFKKWAFSQFLWINQNAHSRILHIIFSFFSFHTFLRCNRIKLRVQLDLSEHGSTLSLNSETVSDRVLLVAAGKWKQHYASSQAEHSFASTAQMCHKGENK